MVRQLTNRTLTDIQIEPMIVEASLEAQGPVLRIGTPKSNTHNDIDNYLDTVYLVTNNPEKVEGSESDELQKPIGDTKDR
jgi:hypothetical protein